MTTASAIADEYNIGQEAMEIIYMSPNPIVTDLMSYLTFVVSTFHGTILQVWL